MLSQILERLAPIPQKTALARERPDIYAAVLLPLINAPDEPTILLTKRSQNLSSHSGQVAFPGGKRDAEDTDLLETALRETHEEIDLTPANVSVLAELPPLTTLQDTYVLPYVGLVPPGLSYRANPYELDAIFTVPVSFLLNLNNLTHFSFRDSSGQRQMPCYRYQGFTIWGFTLNILAGFLNYTLDAGIALEYPESVLKEYRKRVGYRIGKSATRWENNATVNAQKSPVED